MTKERFETLWNECSSSEKVNMFKDYCSYYGCDDEFFNFDDEFFDIFFAEKPMEAARATCFGNVTWSDPYIKFNGYGNLESLSEYEVEELCDEYMETIFEHENIWEDYIHEEDWREDAEDNLISVFESTANLGAINTFIDDEWDESETDDTNIKAFRSWYKKNFQDDKYRLGLDEDACDYLKGSIKEEVDDDIAARFVSELWDYDVEDDDNVRAFADWYEKMNDEKLTVL